MYLKFKNNFIGYFKFYYSIMGNRLLVYLGVSVLVSFLDGMGLAMFMPLLQAIGNDPGSGKESMGNLDFLVDFIQALGFQMNLVTVLVTLALLFSFKGAMRFLQLTFQVKLKHVFIRKIRYLLLNKLKEL